MSLSLKIHVPEQNVTKTMQFHSTALVCDVCVAIHEKLTDNRNLAKPKDYGLFVFDEDPKKGAWLEPARNLGYYLLHDGDTLQYRRKMRPLKVRMLDGTVKTIMVDDSQPVANLMVVICTKILITNHDEYSLVREKAEEENEKPVPTTNFGTLTLRRKKDGDREIDPKMEQLKKKLKTEDETVWVDHSKTLREQGVDESETLLLRRKYFFSDRNIDSHDPVQLNLLYVQCRDAIIDGTHPVTADKACQFAGLQCHIQFGDFVESKHKPGFADVKEFLPQCYTKLKSIEKRIFSEHSNHIGKSEVDTKVEYCKLARELKTYGVSFFLVKEKQKGKNKLVPRLLGVTKDSVLRLDEKTKEILKTWPLTAVKRWGASPNTFTLDFGDYSEKYYSVQTTEGEQISQLISGYIDIILKKKKAKDHFGIEGDEGSSMVEESVSPLRATYVQHQRSEESTKVSADSISKPALLREANGAQTYGRGHMEGAQFGMTHGTASVGHSAPLVLIAELPQFPFLSSQSSSAIARDSSVRFKARLHKHPTVRSKSCDPTLSKVDELGEEFDGRPYRGESVGRDEKRVAKKVGFKEFPTSWDGVEVEIYELDEGRLLVKKLGKLKPNQLPFEIVQKAAKISDRPLRFDSPRREKFKHVSSTKSGCKGKEELNCLRAKAVVSQKNLTALEVPRGTLLPDCQVSVPSSLAVDRTLLGNHWLANTRLFYTDEDFLISKRTLFLLTRVLFVALIAFCFFLDLADTPLRLNLVQAGDSHIFMDV